MRLGGGQIWETGGGGGGGGNPKGWRGIATPGLYVKKYTDTTTAGFAADLDHRPLSVRQDMCAACAAV